MAHELDPGQQRADEEVSRDMQLVLEGQWKLLGSLGSTAEHDNESSLGSLR
jgi:hypothetical protein